MIPKNWLTGWTIVSAALAHDDALDRGSTTEAGFSSALVNPEIVLEFASPVDPIDAGTVSLDPFLQYLADARPECSCLLLGKRVGKPQRVKLSQI
jgi:hypothetical protein